MPAHSHLLGVFALASLLLGACEPLQNRTLLGQHDSDDAGTQAPDAGSQAPDAGSQAPDAGSGPCWQTRELARDVDHLAFTFDSQGVGHFAFRQGSQVYLGSTRPGDVAAPVYGLEDYVSDLIVDAKGQRHLLLGNSYVHEDDGAWVQDWPDPRGGLIRLKLDAQGRAHIILNVGLYPEYPIAYATNRSGRWEVTELGIQVRYLAVDLEVDTQGHAHIAYEGPEAQGVYYATNASGSWVAEQVSDSKTYATALVLDAEGHPHLLYSTTFLQSYYATKQEGQWKLIPMGSPFGFELDLKVDAAGNLHALLSQHSDSNISYAILPSGGQRWNIQRLIYLGRPSPSQYTSLRANVLGFDDAGEMRVGYWYDVGSDQGIHGNYVKYAQPCP